MFNQIFNIKRFALYSQYALLVNWKKKLMVSVGLIIAYVCIILFSLKVNPNNNDWTPVIVFTLIVSGIIIFGSAFPALRKKESTMHFLTIPASNCEKFVYELCSRSIGLLVLTPLMMTLVGKLTIRLYAAIEASRHMLASPKIYAPLSMDILKSHNGDALILIVIGLAFISMLFAGALTFRKHPLIKTLLFQGALITAISSYMYFITQELMPQWLSNTSAYIHSSKLNGEQITNIVIAACVILIIWVLSYAFFKLKEKEI